MSVSENIQWRQRIAAENTAFRKSVTISKQFMPNLRSAAGITSKIGHDEVASDASRELLAESRRSPNNADLKTTAAAIGACLPQPRGAQSVDEVSSRLAAELMSLDQKDPARRHATSQHSDVVDFAMKFYKIHGRTPMQRKPQS